MSFYYFSLFIFILFLFLLIGYFVLHLNNPTIKTNFIYLFSLFYIFLSNFLLNICLFYQLDNFFAVSFSSHFYQNHYYFMLPFYHFFIVFCLFMLTALVLLKIPQILLFPYFLRFSYYCLLFVFSYNFKLPTILYFLL